MSRAGLRIARFRPCSVSRNLALCIAGGVVFLIFGTFPQFAAALTPSISPQNPKAGQVVALTYKINDLFLSNAVAPSCPEVIVAGGISFKRAGIKQVRVGGYNYVRVTYTGVFPQPGTIRVPSATFRVGGKAFTSQSSAFRVVASSERVSSDAFPAATRVQDVSKPSASSTQGPQTATQSPSEFSPSTSPNYASVTNSDSSPTAGSPISAVQPSATAGGQSSKAGGKDSTTAGPHALLLPYGNNGLAALEPLSRAALFGDLSVLKFFWLLPILALFFVWFEQRRVKSCGAPPSVVRWLLAVAVLLVIPCAVLLSGFRSSQANAQDPDSRERDIIIAMDVSKSMVARDLAPSRLDRAKLLAQDLISELGGDRIGLVAFAGSASLQVPLTFDHSAVLNALDNSDTNAVPKGGSDIAAAVRTAGEAFAKAEGLRQIIILISDGEVLSGDALAAADDAALAGIKIFAVGVGSSGGAEISDGAGDFVRDPATGMIVASKLDEEHLRRITEVTGGSFSLADDNAPSFIVSALGPGPEVPHYENSPQTDDGSAAEGAMSNGQARALLRSLASEERKVSLLERRVPLEVPKNW